MPSFKISSWPLLLLPLALAACDSSQPSYSASSTPAAPPAAPAAQPAAQPQPPVAAPPPVAAQPAPVQPPQYGESTAAPGSRHANPERPAPVAPPQQASAHGIRLPPGEQVGIGSCDAYTSRYRACLEDDNSGLVASPQRRYELAHQLTRQVRGWKVQMKSGKHGDIASACAQADAEAKQTLGKLGCKAF